MHFTKFIVISSFEIQNFFKSHTMLPIFPTEEATKNGWNFEDIAN